ncbi:Uncharacterised protein [Neisseria meningitidis]|nr:Uncharacterised protein [Neisseria meningitidis]CKK71286.1 Uncharacterised protein [Neisseria meningitidis]
MKETQGEFVPIIAAAAFGGALGAWEYHGANLYNHGKLGTAQGAATAAGIGAATGVAAKQGWLLLPEADWLEIWHGDRVFMH